MSTKNLLLRIAQADAYCVATEYVSPKASVLKEAKAFKGYLQHPTRTELRPGQYSDDTQMSVAVAEVLLEYDPPFTETMFAEAFVRCFRRDPRKGYSKALQSVLETVETGEQLQQTVKGDSVANGAAMRAVPLGLLSSPQEVLQAAEAQAKVTHNTAEGIWSSKMVAMLSYVLRTSKKHDLLNAAQLHLGDLDASLIWGGPLTRVAAPFVTLKTIRTAFAVIGPALRHNSMGLKHLQTPRETMLADIISLGGDTDTVAAIAWGLAESIPLPAPKASFWWDDLENGPYGRDFLVNLGESLQIKYGA